MRDLYMKNGQGFVLVYSITAQATFNDLMELLMEASAKVKINVPEIFYNLVRQINSKSPQKQPGQQQRTQSSSSNCCCSLL